jgi:outer membrane protein assembly factor BamB
VRAVALDARTGRVVWSRILTMGPDISIDISYNPEALAFELPVPLAAERGVLFATHMGQLFFLDPLSGAVEWMRRYPRAPDDGAIAGTPVSPALLAGATIVVAPRDSCRIYALEAATGRLVWEQPAGRDPFLCGVWRDRVVAAGRGVRLLDRATGAPAGQMKLSGPMASVLGSVAGDRLWLSGANALCRFDLAAMKEMDIVPVSDRLLPIGRHAVGCEPERVAAYLAGPEPLNPAVKLPSVARPVVTPAVEAALAPGKRRPAVEPTGLIAPRLLWRTVMPLFNVSIPDENRGIVLLWGRYAARMIHAEGFGETLWEFNSRAPLSQFVWAGETLVAVTSEAVVGLDPASGAERWRIPGVGPNFSVYLIQGDLFCIGLPKNSELLRINPADGSVRWRCAAPAGQAFCGSYAQSMLRETGGQMYVFMGPERDPRWNWSIVRLGADGKLGQTLFGEPADGSSFFDLTAERAYLVKQGQGTSCWDPALKKKFWALKTNPHYDEPFERAPDRRILPAPDGGPPLWISRPPHNESDNPPRVVLDPLTGERCYEGNGSRWNSSILKTVGTELSRINIGRGKKPQVAWSVKLPSGRDEALRWHLPETGAALGVIRETGPAWDPPHTLRYDVLDPASGKVLAPRTLGWTRDIVGRAEWKYANSRIFVTAGRELLCYQVAAPGGEAAWFAGRRQAALRVADPAERVQALRCANMSEQMFREAELTWRPAGGPLKLDQAWQWLPGAADNALRFADWGGPQDVSCVVTATTNADLSVNLTLDVRDDAWIPLAGGRGDAVIIERDGQRLTVGLDARHFPVVLDEDGAASEAIGVPSASRISRDVVRYTLLIPAAWQLDLHRMDDKALRFILGIAIRDDDGAGVEGVLNWGGPASRSVVRFE